jgi:hypothetical protein
MGVSVGEVSSDFGAGFLCGASLIKIDSGREGPASSRLPISFDTHEPPRNHATYLELFQKVIPPSALADNGNLAHPFPFARTLIPSVPFPFYVTFESSCEHSAKAVAK